MTIQIELDREMEEVLESRARVRGLPVEHYARQVLRQALEDKPSEGGPRRATEEEFQAFLRGIAGDWPGTPLRPGETFDRESIYGDHD